VDCTCAGQVPLCGRCRQQQWSWLAGVAACRGSYWAESVARRMGSRRLEHAWPRFDASARVRELALERVADLARDPQLRLDFARACADAAQERFEELSYENR
jgi:hypothetical protein